MKITSPELKAFIIDILLFEDEVDDKGNNIRRSRFNKAHHRGVMEGKATIREAMEIGVVVDPKADSPEIEWFPARGFKAPEGKVVYAERQTFEEIDLSEAALKAIKFYYDQRQELPLLSPETFEELEAMVGERKVA